jgi:serine/threonine-protein kinase
MSDEVGDSTSGGLIGQIIAGKFRVDRILAEGGMGVVVAATHLHLDQTVALKLPRGEICENREALERFTREGKAAAQMKSEHVARVLDAGAADDGTPYMVMEYLEGHSLAKLLEMVGRLEVESAAEYAIQVCEGLAEAHARGIVHRDVKPDNLFLVERAPGRQIVKLLDFGISKLSFLEKAALQTTIIMGSPCYMSPEQLRSTASVDHRTDLWSLGVTLFELLAGRCPFDGTQPMADLVVSILERPAPDVRAARPEIPEALAAIVARCLARDRDARFQSAAEVARALLPFAPEHARETAERAESMATLLRRSFSSAPPALETNAGPRGPVTKASRESPGMKAPTAAPPRPAEPARVGDGSTPGMSVPPAARLSGPFTPLRSSPIAVLAAVSAAVVVIVALAARGRSPGMVPVVATVAAPPAPSGPAPAGSQGPAETRAMTGLFVRANPASARIAVDGVPVQGNPYHGQYPRNEVHVLEVTARGYDSKSEQVFLANDVFIDVSLDWHVVTSRRTAPPQEVAVLHRAGHPGPGSELPVGAVAGGSSSETSLAGLEVDPTGGHPVVHPIESSNPYGAP